MIAVLNPFVLRLFKTVVFKLQFGRIMQKENKIEVDWNNSPSKIVSSVADFQ